ncbi:RagB/SusD family nutrient uptake outer membrane protein [Chitinophaga eiseniae]|uniref:RagB/SusD family nutrient uptake outer membrane protein n=1 Tax=Chitinophaga eiseniae TaxID=634771 RepID=A0A847SG09_9BACT|nr:RagB/SusD family nutrient uptake outer membrane protein [Chitinophaga eiseniae]NLR82170.1 RagB/SusD family nutrient uptake outer membrane protein [Chitinophaga eiseniae]
MKFRIWLPVILLLLCSTGCKKWLEVSPRSQVKEDEFFTSQGGFQDALTGVYAKMVGRPLYGDYLTMSFLDVLAQRYRPADYYHVFKDDAQFLYQNATVKVHIADIWRGMYSALVNDNNILRYLEINKSVLTTPRYTLIKGEALGLRALMHFDLVRMFGASFVAGADKPAIPYVTEVTQRPTEISTTRQVTDKVITDLLEALSLLEKADPMNGGPDDGSVFLQHREGRMNYLAVKALLARVYLYKNDKVNAGKMAAEVIAAAKITWVTPRQITFYTDYTFSGEHLFNLQVINMKASVDAYFKYHEDETYTSGKAQYELKNDKSVTQRVFETSSGGGTDYRYAYLFKDQSGFQYHIKFWQDDQAKMTLKYRYLMPLIRISEMYYIAAECEADPAKAAAYLNTVRFNRGVVNLPAGLNATQIQEEIRKEYQKEFFSEGQYFFYCKRMNLNKIGDKVITPEKVYPLPLPDNEIDLR